MRNVAAVILAAGGSSRLGAPKQFLEWQGETLLRRVVRSATEARCTPIVVVTAEASERMVRELENTAAKLIPNPNWQGGLGTSIRAGIQQLINTSAETEAVVLLTCDQPFVDASVIMTLIDAWENSGKAIVASRYANTLGVPALFDRTCFETLAALPDTSGAKGFIESRLGDVAEVAFEEGAFDIDTAADYERAKSLEKSR